jgi:hypothetical protein
MSKRNSSASFTGILFFAGLLIFPAIGKSYNLTAVNGMQAFQGSAAARELLGKNGFVVADPAFKQIFEPYIKSPQTEEPSDKKPMGDSLPSFITTDSAWHTYHVLLEEGVKNMEEIQSQRLLNFSRRLVAVISDSKTGNNDLMTFAAVGLGLQDERYRQTLGPEAKHAVDGLRTGSLPVAVPIGFELSPLQFRAQSFYTQSPTLSDYFAARQWYASVVFRLVNPKETQSAITLAALVKGDAELFALWQQLSEPFDAFLAPAEDGTILEYTVAATSVLGTNLQTTLISGAQLAEIQKKLDGQLPLPQVSDQLLSPAQYAEFAKQTRGFRLLPPRRLPDAVCFHNTVDPKIPGRMYPSGLDFLAASPVLRSPAAVRAVQNQFGKSVGDLLLKADCGPMPDSLHGEAMQLLATLQKPLPATAPAPLRTEAWSDLQLWTQLGAWAEQRHTWALHTKLSVEYMGMISPPTGMVAPYPEFFAGLAKLTRQTAAAFDKAGLEQRFEAKIVAKDLLDAFNLSKELSRQWDEKVLEKNSDKLEQFSAFQQRYYEKHRSELEKPGSRAAMQKLENNLEEIVRRLATSGPTNAEDTETLQMFYGGRQNIARIINDYAPVCDRLADLAEKSLTGQPLTEDDAKWIENYGVTLAGFHFYHGNSYEVPRDDFPMVTRVFSSPLTSSMLYAGLARPQALYVIVPNGKTLQLYRGAVMTYREFVRPDEALLDDDSWRELIAKGQTPPAPAFTRSFYAEISVSELLKRLAAQGGDDGVNLADIEDVLWQIGSRASEKNFPELFEMFAHTSSERWNVIDGLAEVIGRLAWDKHQKQLVPLLASPNNMLAKAVARILLDQPARLDVTNLTANFDRQSPTTRRYYCAILCCLPQQTDATHQTYLKGLRDATAGVRWQAVMAIGKSGWNDAQSQSALQKMLNDPNQFVAAAAANSLARIGATNSAPVLLAKLKAVLATTNIPLEMLNAQSRNITQDFRGEENHAVRVLDPDWLETRMYIRTDAADSDNRRVPLRLPPRPVNIPGHNYDLTGALIESLGNLKYTGAVDALMELRETEYEADATQALSKLSPERLSAILLARAKDKQIESYFREKALVGLGNLGGTNAVQQLIPLLDDTTPIVYSRQIPGREWRICDRAALTIAIMLGWEEKRAPLFNLYMISPQRREEMMSRVRDWAKQQTR